MEDYLKVGDDEGWETVTKNKKGKEKKKVEKKEVVVQNRNLGTPKNTKMGGALRRGNNRNSLTPVPRKMGPEIPERRRRSDLPKKKTIPKLFNKAVKQPKITLRKNVPKATVDGGKCGFSQKFQTPRQIQDDNTCQNKPFDADPFQDQKIAGREKCEISEQQLQSQFYIPPQYDPNGFDVHAAILQTAFNTVPVNTHNVGWDEIPYRGMEYFNLPQGFFPNDSIMPEANWFGAAINVCSNLNGNLNLGEIQYDGEEYEALKCEEFATTCQGDEKQDISMQTDGDFNASMQPQFCDNSQISNESNTDSQDNHHLCRGNETRVQNETKKPAADHSLVQQNEGNAMTEIEEISALQCTNAIENGKYAPLSMTCKTDLHGSIEQAKDVHLDDGRSDDTETISSENTNNNCRETDYDDCEKNAKEKDGDLKVDGKVDMLTIIKSNNVHGLAQTDEGNVSHTADRNNIQMELESGVCYPINKSIHDLEVYSVPCGKVLEDESTMASKGGQSSDNSSHSCADCSDTENVEETDVVACEVEPNTCKFPDIRACNEDNGDEAKVGKTGGKTKVKNNNKKKRTACQHKPTYGEVIDYVMAELKKIYAGNDMNDIRPVTKIEDNPLPDGLKKHTKDLRNLSWNYEPCRNRYVDALQSRGDDVDDSSSDDDYEEKANDFGGRIVDYSCIREKDELLQRYRENLHSFAKTSHLLEIVSTPELYDNITQMITDTTCAQDSLHQESDVSKRMQVIVNGEKLQQDNGEDGVHKHEHKEEEAQQSGDLNSCISLMQSACVGNFEGCKTDLAKGTDRSCSKTNNPDETSLDKCDSIKRHAEENIDGTAASHTALVVTSASSDVLPRGFVGNSFGDPSCIWRHDERRIYGVTRNDIDSEYRHLLQDIVRSTNGSFQTDDLHYMLRSRIEDIKCDLDRDFVDFSLATQRSIDMKATSNFWISGDLRRSCLKSGDRDDTPMMNHKDECDYDTGLLENGWINKDFLETLTGHVDCLSTEGNRTLSEQSRKFKPLQYWWMP